MNEDGYVKYRARRIPRSLPDFPLLNTLNEIRTALYKKKLIGMYGDGIGYGNISIRFRDDSFIISGTATGADSTLEKEQYCLVTSCDPQSNTIRSEGMIDASSESMSHWAIYSTLPETNAVIHIHSRPLFDFMLGGDFPETGSSIPYGTPEMAVAIAALVGKMQAAEGIFVMAGHAEGIIAYGKDLHSAYSLIECIYKNATTGGNK
ncbi:MAG: class II aldolase/adducin family protein [Spirochaetales bacterium]|nr:class II aldolase/adducin family protein [Spirochaetales bacterium]